MKDCNGREIKIGDRVIHSEAKYVIDWKNPRYDFPIMKDNRPIMSSPFGGTVAVEGFVGSTCVCVRHAINTIPVYLPCFLEIVE